ncbi:unnamed protein product [Microthlaspi erraticum]|uniref:HMA domain-containing protein n=1 Tax=Microthlaspi erraticum TaxID=1685480 RepID=A0A6D2K435_9BRAS|nr:unnamed protein product [Microthlaspi erraticum]
MTKKPVTDQTLELKTWVLKVSIDCQGCQKKVQKILGGIQGVYATVVDAQHNKVTVTGAVDADKLIKRLGRSGKHAELILPEKKENNKKQSKNAKQSYQEDTGSESKAGMAAEDLNTGGDVGNRGKKMKKKKKKEKEKQSGTGRNAMTVVGSPVPTLPPLDPSNLPVNNGTDPYMVGVMDPIRSNADEYEDEQAGGCFIM